jgi:hypothetical protein
MSLMQNGRCAVEDGGCGARVAQAHRLTAMVIGAPAPTSRPQAAAFCMSR